MAVQIGRDDTVLEEQLMAALPVEKVKTFSNNKGDRVVIYKMKGVFMPAEL